jgi:CRISPR/Cas system-associated exonuclease Cas4 (RecB family)
VVRIEKRTLSPTAINTYLSCPRKFYFRYIEKLKTRPTIYLIRGQIVHKTLHEFHKNHFRMLNSIPIWKIRQELLTIFNNHWEKAENRLDALGLTEEQLESYHDDSELMLLNFSHWLYKNDMPFPDLTEARIHSKNLGLLGIIDAVHETDDKVILVDYKTSKYAKITNDILRQAALYALLYQDKFKKIPDVVWIHFLKELGNPMPVHVDDELLQYGKILIQSVRKDTESKNEKDYPCTCGGYCEKDFIKL